MDKWSAKVDTLEELMREQLVSMPEEKGIDKAHVHKGDGELAWYERDDGALHIYVPRSRRTALITLHHEAIHNLAVAKNSALSIGTSIGQQ